MSDPVETDQVPGAQHPRRVGPFVGHDTAEAMMAEAMSGPRMHHAWLISGPRGLGKATLAYRFARALFGARRIGPRPFDVDPDDAIARRVANLSHGDLFVLRRAIGDRGRAKREIAADDARALPGFFSLAPAEGGWRVAIIDSVDDLNRHGANAILKILEEPPKRCALLLVCHAPGAALATIRSRCRRLELRPLDKAACASAVRSALDVEPDARAIALAKGRPGRAVSLQALGAPAMAEALETALRRVGRDGARAFTEVAFDRGSGGDAQDRLDLMLDLALDMIADAVAIAGRGEAGGPLAGLVGPGNAPRWAKVWSDLARLREETDRLGQDATHAMLRAGAIMAEAGAGSASA